MPGGYRYFDSDADEEGPIFDFVYDGDTQLGPERKKVRRALTELRALAEDVLNGADPEPFELKVGQIYKNVNRAIEQCDREAARNPKRAPFFMANIEAYSAILEALEGMDVALQEGDAEQLVRAYAAFEDGVAQIDDLVATGK